MLTTRNDVQKMAKRTFTAHDDQPPIGNANRWNTHESESSTLGLFLTTELEAMMSSWSDQCDPSQMTDTHCLHRLSTTCILYLHEVHSSRSTTFFVVLAYFTITLN